jgi:serine phosphatase RsbU (regulator of sigma subunit)
VREFIRWSAEELGIALGFEGEGAEEVARVAAVEGSAIDLMIDGETESAGAETGVRRETFGLSLMGLAR